MNLCIKTSFIVVNRFRRIDWKESCWANRIEIHSHWATGVSELHSPWIPDTTYTMWHSESVYSKLKTRLKSGNVKILYPHMTSKMNDLNRLKNFQFPRLYSKLQNFQKFQNYHFLLNFLLNPSIDWQFNSFLKSKILHGWKIFILLDALGPQISCFSKIGRFDEIFGKLIHQSVIIFLARHKSRLENHS